MFKIEIVYSNKEKYTIDDFQEYEEAYDYMTLLSMDDDESVQYTLIEYFK